MCMHKQCIHKQVVDACMRACVLACMRACVHACMRACVHVCMRTHTLTYILAQTLTHICTHARTHAHTHRRELLMATSPFLKCGLLLQTWKQYSDAEITKACVEIPFVLISASQVVPVQTHANVVRSLLKNQALVTD